MFPKISITIPVYNEEKNIRSCLDSIALQDYPKDKMEVIIVDGGSTDGTTDIAREFPFVIVLDNPEKDTHISKMIGLKSSSGEFWTYFDADLQANGSEWAGSMVQPLLESSVLAASVSRYHGRPEDSLLEKYINLDPIGRDTLFAWFTPGIESTIEEWRNGYAVCCYQPDSIPPEGRCLFRRSLLMELIGHQGRFRELDTLLLLTRAGHTQYAYVPEPGYYHRHPKSLFELHRKRKRNAVRNYIPGHMEGYIQYTWFDLKKPKDFLKMCTLVFYAFSLIGPIFVGIWKTIKYRSMSGMVEVVYVPVAVEAYLEAFISDKQGRLFLKQVFKNFPFCRKKSYR
jgi:glycosyltransferase involved in cell wall biosynthesis